MKNRVLKIALLCSFLIFLKLASATFENELFIKNYEKGEIKVYLVKPLLFLNFSEPYIAHYNYGNGLYINGEFENAEVEYMSALKSVPDSRECDVRINLALSKLARIDVKNRSDEVIKELEDIQKVLLEHGCASESEGGGSSEEAQEIYDETEKEIEEQKSKSENGDGDEENAEQQESENENGEGDENSDTEETIENESEKLSELQKQREAAESKRNPSQEMDLNTDYDAKVW